MISFSAQVFGSFIFFSAFVYGIVGSSNQNESQDIPRISTNQTDTQELCSLLLAAKTSLMLDFQRSSELIFPNGSFFANCDVNDNCSSLSCRALLGEDKVKAGVSFRLCELSARGIEFWAVLPKDKWAYVFPVGGNHNGEMQRVEIKRKLNVGIGYSETKWFIKFFSEISRADSGEEYLSLTSSLQICETDIESSCQNKTLINLSLQPFRYPCDVSLQGAREKLYSYDGSPHKKSSSRSSRSVFNPEDLHTKNNTSENLISGTPSHKVGQPCDTMEIFDCGSGAGCVNAEEGKGVCQCLKDFDPDSNGICQKKPADIPSDPPSQPVNNTSSYSTALGALLSVFILLSLAAAVFFGTKYHVFSRIRNRLPLNLRCWPFPVRRASPLEDNVSLVNPIDQDDDEPLLL